MLINKLLSPISFTYLVIDPFPSVDAEKATIFNWKKLVLIPIPLTGATLTGNDGAFSRANDFVSGLTGFIQKDFIKSLDTFTESGLNIVQKLAKVGNTEIELKSSDLQNGVTFQAQGQGQFTLILESDMHNLAEPALDAYVTLAGNSFSNTRFHYISNKTVMFNLLCQRYTKTPNGMNSVITLNLFKPQKGIQVINSDPTANNTANIGSVPTADDFFVSASDIPTLTPPVI